MNALLLSQFNTVFIFFLTGICIGLLFDFFRIQRKVLKTCDFITYIQDILFWILAGFVILFSIFKFNNGEIIYNGIAKDDIRGRIQKHLLGNVEEGFSAISIDLYLSTEVKSHKKKICSKKGNSAYFENIRIRNKELCQNLNFTDKEISFLNNSNSEEYYFRNGINVTEEKHINHTYIVYYLSGFKSLSYGEIIEKRWREKFGLPRLCTYNKGR